MKILIEIVSFVALIWAAYLMCVHRWDEATYWLVFSAYGDILILKRAPNTTGEPRK